MLKKEFYLSTSLSGKYYIGHIVENKNLHSLYENVSSGDFIANNLIYLVQKDFINIDVNEIIDGLNNKRCDIVENRNFENNKIITIEGDVANFKTKVKAKNENYSIKINCLGYVGRNDESYISNWIGFHKNFKSHEYEKFLVIAIEDLEKISINIDKLIENNNGYIVKIEPVNILKLETIKNKNNEKEIKLYETNLNGLIKEIYVIKIID